MRQIPRLFALLLIASVPCETVVQYPALGSAARLVGLGLAGAWFANVLVEGRWRRPTPLHAAFASFAAWCAVSVLWSGNPDRSAAHVVTWLQLLLLTVILWDVLPRREDVRDGLQAFVLGGAFTALSTVQNYLAGSTFKWERFNGAGVDPDDMGNLLAISVPIACYLAAEASQSGWRKWLNLLYLPLALAGIALSGTRTAVVALFPGLAFALVTLMRVRASARVVAAALVVVSWAVVVSRAPEASIARLRGTASAVGAGELSGRLSLWAQGWESVKAHPLGGVGTNMYRSVNFEGKVCHNSMLSVLVEVGLVGLALYLCVLAAAFLAAWRLPPWHRGFWLAVLAAWAISSSMVTWEYHKATWLLLVLVVCSEAAWRRRPLAVDPAVSSLSAA